MMVKKKEPRSKDAILNATIELLETTSFSTLTIEAVASHAGVGKTTIYRWWENKAYLVLDAFWLIADSQLKFDENKSLHEGFCAQLQSLANVLNSKVGRSILAIIAENEEIADAFYTSYLRPRRADSKRMLQTRIEKGELQPIPNTDIILDMLYGPIYFQILIYKKVPDADYINELVTQVMKTIMTP